MKRTAQRSEASHDIRASGPRAGEGEQRIREIDSRLRSYGCSRHENKDDPIDELLFIILSAQTEAYSYRVIYSALHRAFPNWQEMIDASDDQIADVIRCGGLANKKARQIKGALAKIVADFGGLTLEPLRAESNEDAESYLTTLPGIGAKSAKCILLYSFHRELLPVDTHVWRISRRLKIAPLFRNRRRPPEAVARSS